MQDLNLEDTELVTLSACDSGKGTLDYSEGVYDLVSFSHHQRSQRADVAVAAGRPLGARIHGNILSHLIERSKTQRFGGGLAGNATLLHPGQR